MSRQNSIKENEVYRLGSDIPESKKGISRKNIWIIAGIGFLLAASVLLFAVLSGKETEPEVPQYFFEPEDEELEPVVAVVENVAADSLETGYIEVVRDTINDVIMDIFIPHNLTMSLMVGMPDTTDVNIAFAAMAADIRRDNEQIVGDFVVSGYRLSRGVAKRGFCAIINNTISIGMGEDTPLLGQAVDSLGYFFRQYPLVNNGEVVENNPRNISFRRALAVREERVIIIESKTRESFHDFSRALVDMGVSDAIYLVGGDAYGWFRDKERLRHDFGQELSEVPDNISYIIWLSE